MRAIEVVAEVGLDDGIDVADLLFFAGGVITMLTLWALVRALPVWKRICDFFQWWEKFRDDWDGVPARPGHDAVPGFPERMNDIDGEFKRNGGSTLKDAVFETQRVVKELQATATTLVGRMDASDEVRAAILSVSNQNMEATRQAFISNGLEPPTFYPITPPTPRKEES